MLFSRKPRLAEIVSRDIQKDISRSAFRFHAHTVLKRVEVAKQDQQEQDRIFNELVVNALVLVYLMIDTTSRIAEGKQSRYLKEVRDGIYTTYLNQLKEYKVDKKYVDMWKELLEMRTHEYERERNKNREYLPEPSEGNPWLAVVSIGCFLHIRKEKKPSEKDSLSKEIREWLGSVAIQMENRVIKEIKKIEK